MTLDREFADRINEAHVPFSGSLELTHRCNLQCRHCYQFRPHGGELDTEQWIALIRDLADCGCLFLGFTGGEPLLREDLFDILAAAAERNFVMTLQTNATLLDRSKVSMLSDMPTLRVDVSLYGSNSSTHDGLTGVEGSFATTLRALEMLREKDVPVLAKVVVGDFNLDEVEGIVALTEGLGVKAIFSSLIFPKNDRDPSPTSMRIDDAGLERFLHFEKDYMLSNLGEILGIDSGELTMDDLEGYLQKCALGPDTFNSENRRFCGGASTVFAVNPYGDVYPCVTFPLVVGNIQEEKFIQIWKHSPELRGLRIQEDELPKECRECFLLDKCAICRALSYLEKGEPVAFSQERCRQTRVLMKVLGHEQARK